MNSFIQRVCAVSDTTEWFEFTVKGPVDSPRYRTSYDASNIQFWSDHNVPGIARKGWNRTKSANVQLTAIRELKKAGLFSR